MRIADFDLYKDLFQEGSGLALTESQSFLLDSRLTPIARKWGYPSFDAMTLSLRALPEPGMVRDVIAAMTFTETEFFGEDRFCDHIAAVVLPWLAKKRVAHKPLRFWSAACSSGQEPYSVAITLLENEDTIPGRKIELLATDLSDAAIEEAVQARYNRFKAQQGLSTPLLLKYFESVESGWTLKKEVRNMVRFDVFNLLDDTTPLGIFDVILCRNVLNLFEGGRKKDALNIMMGRLAPDGFLFLADNGAMPEALGHFRPVQDRPGLYVPRDSAYVSS